MKKLLMIFGLFLVTLVIISVNSYAQDVLVSATVHDPNGQVFAYGTYSITFLRNPTSPVPTSQYFINGNSNQPVNPGPYTGLLDNTGTFSTTLINGSNSELLPAGSQWLVQACPDVGAGGGSVYSCTQITVSFTGNQDISAQLNAATGVIGVQGLVPMATAYTDANIVATSLRDGTFYFNILDQTIRCYFQGAWLNCSGGGSRDKCYVST